MKMITQKFMMYLMVLSFSLTFTACNKDDDGNGPAFSKDGKRLVRSISFDAWESDREKEVYNFKYNGDGQLIRIEGNYTFESEENGRSYTDAEIYTFSQSDKKLTVKYVYKDGENSEDNEYMEGTFSLNDDGLVVSGTITDEYEDAPYAYQCFYNENRQLIKTICVPHNGTKNYIWENDNYTEIKHNGWSEKYYYSNIENKSNMDLGTLISEGLGDDDFFLGITGYLGKGSKHLPTSNGSSTTFTYEFDSEGYVTKVIEKSYGEEYIYTIQYN